MMMMMMMMMMMKTKDEEVTWDPVMGRGLVTVVDRKTWGCKLCW